MGEFVRKVAESISDQGSPEFASIGFTPTGQLNVSEGVPPLLAPATLTGVFKGGGRVVGLLADWAMPSRLLIPRRGTSKPAQSTARLGGWLHSAGDLANKSPARGGAKRQASERMNNARDSSNRLAQRTIINGKMSRATSAIRPTAEEGSMKMCSRLLPLRQCLYPARRHPLIRLWRASR